MKEHPEIGSDMSFHGCLLTATKLYVTRLIRLIFAGDLQERKNRRNFAGQSGGSCEPHLLMLEWWNGRHEGLKILWPLRLCGFESRFEHKNECAKACKPKLTKAQTRQISSKRKFPRGFSSFLYPEPQEMVGL